MVEASTDVEPNWTYWPPEALASLPTVADELKVPLSASNDAEGPAARAPSNITPPTSPKIAINAMAVRLLAFTVFNLRFFRSIAPYSRL
jgi:hypothetical protein